MARITLFRHAKAEYPLAGKDDYNRTLAPRGRRNADRMGRFILENNLIPDLVIVSGAARTRETYDRASVHWPSLPTIFTDSIYEASATTILTAIEAHGGDLQNVMVIGHNPGLAVLLHHLVDSSIAHTDLSPLKPGGCAASCACANCATDYTSTARFLRHISIFLSISV
jgi:phosphohistidine phosphatase